MLDINYSVEGDEMEDEDLDDDMDDNGEDDQD